MKLSWRRETLTHLEFMRSANPKSVDRLRVYYECWLRRKSGKPLADEIEDDFADNYERIVFWALRRKNRYLWNLIKEAWEPAPVRPLKEMQFPDAAGGSGSHYYTPNRSINRHSEVNERRITNL